MEEDARRLASKCNEAFDLYPSDCSHAVWHVIKSYNPGQPYMQANALVSHIARSPEWKEVSLYDLSGLASQGTLVVGGLQAEEHGHVIVVYPGPEKPKGGYFFTNKKTGEKQYSQASGLYARAMSTSFSRHPFPGTISRGDKTVRDPWPEKQFQNVKFWKYVGTAVSTPVTQRENAKRFRDTSEEIWI